MARRIIPILFLLAAIALTALGQGTGTGTRVDLTPKLPLNVGVTGQFCQLFVPDYYLPPQDGRILLVFHLHSASWAAEDEVYKARTNAVLVNIHLGALSSPYANYFAVQTRFQQIVDTALSVLSQMGIVQSPSIGALIVTSFSAGYAGVRELLKVPAYYTRMDVLNLADGLHANSDPATKAIQMHDFLRFATDARSGTKVMLMTHSSIPTSGYESTTQTADYLLAGMGLSREPSTILDDVGQQYGRCDTSSFHLRAYTGETASDHMKHLYGMHLMITQALSILGGSTTVQRDEGEGPRHPGLLENYPNPFNADTEIAFHVPSRSAVRLEVYDVLGRNLATLVHGELEAGDYRTRFDARSRSSGTYFLCLSLEGVTESRRIVLTK